MKRILYKGVHGKYIVLPNADIYLGIITTPANAEQAKSIVPERLCAVLGGIYSFKPNWGNYNLMEAEMDWVGEEKKPGNNGHKRTLLQTEHLEYCCNCNQPTGCAGKGDDSHYTEDGKGPYCWDCWERLGYI